MKKIIIFISTISFLLLLTLVSMSNMNVLNLLIFGSDYAGGSNSKMEAFDTDDSQEDSSGQDGESKNTVSDSALETLQSGLLAGAGGGTGSLNLLWLLQNAKDPNKESYAYQLLEAYSNLRQGVYNNYTTHITVEGLAGSHYTEASLGSFVVPDVSGYGKPQNGILGKTINGKKITLTNATKSDIIGNVARTSSAVWKDSNKDGCPDGPFQTIQCGAGNSDHADKTRTNKTYDLYSFVDAMNIKDSKYNTVASAYEKAGLSPGEKGLTVLNALVHNRGNPGAWWLMFGLPYDASVNKDLQKILHNTTTTSLTKEDLEISYAFHKQIFEWFDKSNIPLEDMSSKKAVKGISLLLVLANGGFLDTELLQSHVSALSVVPQSTLDKLFPGQTNKTIVSYINKNYVKKPWDVLGMTKEKYQSIYGGGYTNSYEERYVLRMNTGLWYNTVFYIDKSVKSSNYKAGENVVVRALDGIALAYIFDTGIKGAFVTLSIAIEAGIKSLTDGTVVDPSNPQIFYGTLGTDTYNPAEAATGNFGKFLEGLGLAGKLTEPQQAQIKAMYDVSGGLYSQPKRWSQTEDGNYYLDCSSFASIGLHMGMTAQAKSPNPTTYNIKFNGMWQKSTLRTAEVNGKTYPAKTVQLDKSGKPMAESTVSNNSGSYARKDVDWLPYLQTGDIVNGNNGSSGHVFTYLGKNNTDKDMVLEQHISKVHAQASKYKPGEHFTIQASWSANSYDGGNGKNYSGKMGLMRLWYDTSGLGYQAFRPVYNLR